MKCLKEKCIHHDVCALYTFSGYASDECGFYETKPHVENEKPQWIPVTYRQMDNDEYCKFREEYGEIPVEERKVFDCQMPEDGQEILISTKYEHIFLDTCVYDYGYGLEEYGDWEDVIAWMPLPAPYIKEGDQK